jgi:bifunctional UDP-N-acetylglucosamine pyrophosphorylase/glucosamine-1-phosphate N-acetyltransferase
MPMLSYVLASLSQCEADGAVVVIGHKGDWVAKAMGEADVAVPLTFVEQRQQRGTGDAALIGLSGLPDDPDEGDVLIMPGDTPLLRPETISELVRVHRERDAAATVLTAILDDATGYGRVVRRRDGNVAEIVEHGDATPEQLEIGEINTSIYCFKRSLLAPALRRLTPDNAQGEYYLTDVIKVLALAGHPVGSVATQSVAEASGVNDRVQLAAAEQELRRRTNESLLRSGVTMLDPANTYVDTTVTIGRDVTLFPGVILQGSTVVGDRSEIGPHTRLVDCVVGADAVISFSSGRNATVGDGAQVGPYAVLEPNSVVASNGSTGAFYTGPAVES